MWSINLSFHGLARPSFSKLHPSEVSRRSRRNAGSHCRRLGKKPEVNHENQIQIWRSVVQPGVTTNITWITTIPFGSEVVSGVFPLYHVDYANKYNDLPGKTYEKVSLGANGQFGN